MLLCDLCQAVVALSDDVDSHAFVDTIKSCSGAEVYKTDSVCHLR